MSSQSRRSTPASAERASAAASGAIELASNGDHREVLRTMGVRDVGLASFRGALASWLGGDLYAAVERHLTLDALRGHADRGLKEAFDTALGTLDELDGMVDRKAVEQFGKLLSGQYEDLARQWLRGDGGEALKSALGDWVDADTGAIVQVGLLAAGGALLTDLDIPGIKQKFGIAENLSAELEAELGSMRNLALQEIKARLEYASGPLMAAIRVSHDDGGDDTLRGELGLSDETYSLRADVEFTEKGFKAYGATGLLEMRNGEAGGSVRHEAGGRPVITGKFTRSDGSISSADEVRYDANTGVFTFTDTRTTQLYGRGAFASAAEFATDGSRRARGEVEAALGEHGSAIAGFSHERNPDGTGGRSAHGALTYDNERGLEGRLEASGRDDGTGRVEGSGSWQPDERVSLGVYGHYEWGDDPDYEVGGSVAYEEGRTRVSASGRYASENEAADLTVRGQRYFDDDFAVRASLGLHRTEDTRRFDAALHGAWFLRDDLAGIAGGRYSLDESGRSSFVPEVGAQVKGVPLVVGYEVRSRRWVVGAMMRF